MLLNRPLNPKHLSKHKILKHFIETADQNCISNYYNDPYFRHIPSAVLFEYIKQLEEEGYLRAMLRHVILKAKAYSYLSDRRNQIIKKLARPVSSFIAWILGIASTLLAEYLIRIIFK